VTSISASLGDRRRIDLPWGPVEYRERGEGAVVLFIHGILANGDVWRHVVPELADRYRCVTPDLPFGAHRLGMRDGMDFTLPGCARLVADLIERLEVDDVTVVGNDTGGAVAQWVVARHAERVGRLVLTPCDAFENFPPPVIRHIRVTGRSRLGLRLLGEGLRFRPLQRLPIALGRLTERPIPAEIVRSYTRWIRESPDCRRDFARMVAAISPRFTEEVATMLAAFEKPVLVVWADERRRFFPLEHGRRLAAAFPDARLAVVAERVPFLTEDQPVATARHIARFLDGAARPTGPVDRAGAGR
jgi:pimeloyl-ACP methyl ester carboxylesterase